jgi:S-(hydroxymethyl)glutathione dehydrogenase/alcohol dehydrogenase
LWTLLVCKHDLWSQCDNSNPTGGWGYLWYSKTFGGYDGGQAEYLRVPYANVGPTIVTDDLIDEEVLFLLTFYPHHIGVSIMLELKKMIRW